MSTCCTVILHRYQEAVVEFQLLNLSPKADRLWTHFVWILDSALIPVLLSPRYEGLDFGRITKSLWVKSILGTEETRTQEEIPQSSQLAPLQNLDKSK